MKKRSSNLLLYLLLSCIAFYLANRFTVSFQGLEGDLLEKLNISINNFLPELKANPLFISVSLVPLSAGLIACAIVWLVWLYNCYDQKNYMPGIEHGSAEWGESKDIKPLMDPDPQRNIILTATEGISLHSTKDPEYNRNKNVLVIGGAGSGKTRFYVKPNIMQMHSSYVITDPKGEILRDCGKMLQDNGYKLKVLNLIEMDKSDFYNPFNYIKDEKDILKLVNNLITNTTSPGSKSSDEFWTKAETALLQALFGYVLYETLPNERNIGTVLKLLRLAEAKEEDESFKSGLDIIFEELKERTPDHFAVKQYDIFKLAAGKTAKSILVTLGVRLSPFYIEAVEHLLSDDTMELENIGEEKTALFIIIPDSDPTFNFIAAIMYQQLFDILFYKADHEHDGRLPFPVRFILDEFANIGRIPNFVTYVATMRSREISVNVILQNLSQLKSTYKDSWETIVGNCDSILFLGGSEESTLEYVSKRIGKTTIDNRNINETKGQSASYSLNYQILGRDLITPDEVGRMPNSECILLIRGLKPFKSQKYDIESHPNYQKIGESNKNNRFVLSDEAKNICLDNVKEVIEL